MDFLAPTFLAFVWGALIGVALVCARLGLLSDSSILMMLPAAIGGFIAGAIACFYTIT